MIKKRICYLTIIIVMIFAASLLVILLIQKNSKQGSVIAEIYRDDQLLQTINLSEVSETYQIRLEYGENDYNILQIEAGRIAIIEASCPDLLCVKMGYIDSSLMPITCLPNHLIIKVYKDTGDARTDGMTF